MANEAVIKELLGNGGDPVSFAVADGSTIPKGSLMVLSDPRTIAISSGDNQPFAGIASHEKVANDGSERMTVWTHGIFDLKDSGAGIAVGERVSIKSANTVAKVAGADQLFSDVGIALETAGAGEVIQVLIGSGF